jgi:hypothetical protein
VAIALIAAVILLVAWAQAALGIQYIPIGDLFLVQVSKITGLNQALPPTSAIPTPGKLPTGVGWAAGMEVWELDFLSPPEWMPAGFSSAAPPAQMLAYEQTLGLWTNNLEDTIRLFVAPKAGGMHPFAPPETYEEVKINGAPAIIIRGHYRPTSPQDPQADRPWDEALGLQLYWTVGSSVYSLETLGPYVEATDLIRMAESMQPIPTQPR